jgi:hypothetical protein
MSASRPGQVAVTVSLLGFAILIAVLSAGLGPVARIVPLSVVFPVIALLLYQIGRELSQRPDARAEVTPPRIDGERRMLAWLIALAVLVYALGITVGGAVFVVLYLKFESGETWFVSAASSFAVAVILRGVFAELLGISLEGGLLG